MKRSTRLLLLIGFSGSESALKIYDSTLRFVFWRFVVSSTMFIYSTNSSDVRSLNGLFEISKM